MKALSKQERDEARDRFFNMMKLYQAGYISYDEVEEAGKEHDAATKAPWPGAEGVL